MLDTIYLAYFGTNEMLICAAVVLLLFGGAKLPQLARGLGEGIREFKKSVGGEDSANKATSPDDESDTAKK